MPDVPVYLRAGYGEEFEIGSFRPSVSLDPLSPPGPIAKAAAIRVDWRRPLADLLRQVAADIDKEPDGDHD